MGLFSRKKKTTKIPTGRQTQIGSGYGSTSASAYRSITRNQLDTLRRITDVSTALKYLSHTNPDASRALWNYIRLSNQGNSMTFYKTKKYKTKIAELEEEWREFASRINELSNKGLDGLIDQMHYSAFLLSGMTIEVEVTKDLKDIYDVHVISPQSIKWELADVNGHKKYIPYQYNAGKKIPLDPAHANFFWVPTDPGIGKPEGTYMLEPSIQAVDFQLQIFQDLQMVLHHQGWQRDDYAINTEQTMSMCPPNVKNDPKKLEEWQGKQLDNFESSLKSLEPDSDIVHFDNVTRNQTAGANNQARSLDVRAITEMVDTQILNGMKQLGTFQNRSAGKTETWSTVEFKIMVQAIKSSQRGSKRLIEEIARLWLRLKGVQAVPKFEHNIVDWESESDKIDVKLKQQEYYAKAQKYGWIDPDKAAQEAMGVEKAYKKLDPSELEIKNSQGGDTSGLNDKQKGNSTKQN